MATDMPAKPTPAAQRADTKPEAASPAKPEAAAPAKPAVAAPAKPKPAAARKRAGATRRAATKRGASAKRAATAKRATDAPKATAASKTTPAAPKPDRNRAAFLSVLDAQERTANAIADYQTNVAELSRIPGATTLANAQADLLRRVTVTYVTAARHLLK